MDLSQFPFTLSMNMPIFDSFFGWFFVEATAAVSVFFAMTVCCLVGLRMQSYKKCSMMARGGALGGYSSCLKRLKFPSICSMCMISGHESHVMPPAVRYHFERSRTGTFLMEGNAERGTSMILPSSRVTDILPLMGKATFFIFGMMFQNPSTLFMEWRSVRVRRFCSLSLPVWRCL